MLGRKVSLFVEFPLEVQRAALSVTLMKRDPVMSPFIRVVYLGTLSCIQVSLALTTDLIVALVAQAGRGTYVASYAIGLPPLGLVQVKVILHPAPEILKPYLNVGAQALVVTLLVS